MNRLICRVLLAAAVAGIGAAMSHSAAADMISFDNQCGDANWHTCCDCATDMKCNNWSVPSSPAPVCPSTPTGDDDVTIVGDCTIDANKTGTALTIMQSGGTFTVNGVLNVGDEAVFDGPVVWNSGEIGRAGGAAGQQAICNAGITIQGDAPKTLSGFGGFRLTNQLIGSWSGAGDWTIGMIPGACCPSIFENAADGTFNVLTDASILQTAFGVGEFENKGILNKQSTGLSEWEVNLRNTGTVHVQAGELRLTRAGAIGGTWNINSGAELGIAGNFFTLEPGVVIQGRAVVKQSGTNVGVNIEQNVTIDDLTIASDGRLGGAGTLHIAGTLINEADSMTNEAGDPNVHLHILSGGTFIAMGTNALIGQVDVEGEMQIPAGAATGCFNQLLNVMPGGVVMINDGATLTQIGLVTQPIENHGLIRKQDAGGESRIANSFNAKLLNRADGRIFVPAGTLRCQNFLDQSGTIDVDAGAEFSQEGWATYHDGASVVGDGFFHINAAQNNFVDAGVELVIERFRMSGNGGTGHGLHGNGSLRITNEADLKGGYFSVPVVTIDPNATAIVSGPNFTGGQTTVFENHGTLQLAAQSFGFANFRNRSDGVVDIQADFAFLNWFSNGPCANEGLLRKSAGVGDSNIVCSVTNTGVFRAESGRMVFPNAVNTFVQDAGATELAGGGIVVTSMTLNGGTLRGEGTLAANVTNNGALVEPGSSPGVLEIASSVTPLIDGRYTQSAGGTLVIEVGGLAAGTEHDQLMIASAATLAGTLELRQLGGFVPSDGDEITVLLASSITGGFDDVVLIDFPSSISATTRIESNAVVVTFDNSGNSDPNMNSNANANDNSNTNSNGNTSNNDNTAPTGNDNGNDNSQAPQATPDDMATCGSGACGAGLPPLMLSLAFILGARRRRG
ncbi:MAG: hypothetical protein H6818_03415 [Phycisphaerales bacterium]|nr:hypothetical protein [Phycisphaerales bacterium]